MWKGTEGRKGMRYLGGTGLQQERRLQRTSCVAPGSLGFNLWTDPSQTLIC